MRLQLLYYFFKPFRLLYASILVVTLIAAALESLGLAVFFPVFSSMLDNPEGEVGGFLGIVTSISELLPFSDPIVAASSLLLVIFFLKMVFTLLREGLAAYGSAKVLYNTKKQVIERYAGSQYQFFLDSKQGDLIYGALAAPHRLAVIFHTAPQMVAELLRIIALFVVLMLVSPYITLALAGLGLVYFGAIHYLSKKVSYNIGKGKANADAAQTVIANEFLSGIRQIITFRTLGGWLGRFARENRIYAELHAKGQIWLAIPKPLMEFMAVATMLGVLLVLRVVSPSTFSEALPRLGVFALGLVMLLPSLTLFGRSRMQMMASLPDTERIYDTLTSPVPRREDGDRILHSFERGISFENVSFTHKGRDTLLDRVSLNFEKGKVTGIVGPSGAGKTTLVNLILGLFEPTGGTIAVDGVTLKEYKVETWLRRVGFVSQEPFIYHSTIAENIAFSRNAYPEEAIIRAAEIANAHGFISELPQGYETMVGDRGMKLSGGQQQRICIARAVLDEPEVLIFDEATSSLDSISEKLVQEAIDNVSQDRTVILIAHRLSTIRYADKIVVLDQGRVIEEGNHEELLERQGHYSRLVAASR